MNWEAIGAVGELIGALAVIITLLALVRQIRLTNNSLLATMTFGVLSEANSFNSKIGSDRDAARLLEVAMNAPRDLAPEDQIQAQAIIRQIVNLAACGYFVKDSHPSESGTA